MMNRLKRRWLLVPVGVFALAAVVVGALATGAGGLSADGDEDADGDTFAARVATILGLDEATVSDAMTQAKREMRSEALRDALDAKVEAGHITQEQADEYFDWAESAPEWAEGGRHFGRGDHDGRRGHGKKFGRGWR